MPQRQHPPSTTCSLARTVVAARAPVHRRTPSVCEAPLEHPDEQPLIPLVVLGVARGELALPGVADAEPLELSLHVRDVAARRHLRMNAALDGSVFGREAERIPSERMQHVVAAHPLGPRNDVADDVVADVAHVCVTRRVREHLEAIELRTRRVLGHLERASRGPALLPFPVELLWVVVGHRMRVAQAVGARTLQRARPSIISSRTCPNARGRPRSRRRRAASDRPVRAACPASSAAVQHVDDRPQ